MAGPLLGLVGNLLERTGVEIRSVRDEDPRPSKEKGGRNAAVKTVITSVRNRRNRATNTGRQKARVRRAAARVEFEQRSAAPKPQAGGHNTTDKISGDQHLSRSAFVYIRQSTLQQVRNNTESGHRQYALESRAKELGFKTVVVIDEDLGVSGTGSHERPGFAKLLAAVCNGEVGAVLALEASRLARNNRDWHHLIDLCVLTETLVMDAEGIYDPRLLNDRMLLGLKGTMSEFEIGVLRQRAQEAYRQKVLRGEVLTMVPVGYERTADGGMEMTADRQIRRSRSGAA